MGNALNLQLSLMDIKIDDSINVFAQGVVVIDSLITCTYDATLLSITAEWFEMKFLVRRPGMRDPKCAEVDLT